MAELTQFLDGVRRDVDSTLNSLVPRADVEPLLLHEAIRWSLFAGGKRIRPAILVAVGQTFGADDDQLARTAAAVEMIHTYSLIHDDLPSMDDDDMRRGRATSHIQFGEATAILAGDVLQTLAFKAIAEDENLPPEMRIKLISCITDAAGTPSGMVAGQQLDLNAEGQPLRIEEIEQIHCKKTGGAIILAAALAGAIIGGASDEDQSSIRNYASKLGLLFQITDDLLDVTQQSSTLGKTAGKDAAAEKATYPSHFGVEQTHIMAKYIHNEACEALLLMDRDTKLLHLLADFILDRSK